jgi:hypothetical protein
MSIVLSYKKSVQNLKGKTEQVSSIKYPTIPLIHFTFLKYTIETVFKKMTKLADPKDSEDEEESGEEGPTFADLLVR